MRDFRNVLPRLQAFQRKFEALLASARKTAARAPSGRAGTSSRLRELTGFGANPGNLRMFAYAPGHLPPGAPLVVALHGCTQTADEYDYGTGWSSLADSLGFAVVYPEQQPSNNPKNCFSWFLPGDTARDQGEAHSIRQMVEHAIKSFASDRRKVFVTGLSAGGAMASVMLATYPEVFAGGAIIAGLPYGSARNVQQAFEAMFADEGHSAHALGDCVRAASRHAGPWPKISVWHGSSDPIVKPSNGQDIVRQWANVHGISEKPAYQESIDVHSRRVWTNENGEPLIEAFSISNMAHGVPLATSGEQTCGNTGAFFLDAGISSTHLIARFWGLDDVAVEVPHAAAAELERVEIPADRGAVLVTSGISQPSNMWAEALSSDAADGEARQTDYAFDPNAVIAEAFKAAGLPVPEIPTPARGGQPRVAPGPIIVAALKAAGLQS